MVTAGASSPAIAVRMRRAARWAVALGAFALSVALLASPAAAKRFDAETFTLANGLQVVVIPIHRAPIASQMVWYKAGAADDPRGASGIAHFLEHLMFRGTRTVAPGAFSHAVADIGGRDNAFTMHDYTGFYETVAADRLATVMRLDADRMANLVITDAKVSPERKVIIEERHTRIDNNPQSLFQESFDAALYLNLPYHRPVIGWLAEMQRLSTVDALAFYRAWYAPNNAVVVISGDVTPAQVRALAEKYYGPIPARPVPAHVVVPEPPHVVAVSLTMKSARVPDPSWLRAYLAPSYTAGDAQQAYALQVAAEILGDGATSRLYKGLVVDRKLALDAGAYYDPTTRYLSNFGFYATVAKGVDPAAFQDAALDIVHAAVRDGLTAEEVARAKARMQAEAVYARDSLDGLARSVGAAVANGRTLDDVEAWPDRIGAVTVEQVNAALKSVLDDNHAVTGFLLPERTS